MGPRIHGIGVTQRIWIASKSKKLWTLVYPKSKIQRILFGFVMLLLGSSIKYNANFRSNGRSNKTCLASFGTYNGNQYTSGESTIGQTKCLVESKWMKVMQHSVQIISKDDGQKMGTIDDWLFIDYHDRVNVLVQDYQTKENLNFLVMNQTKYSLEGRYSLAVVGGIIEPGEEPKNAAKREVKEEMNVECNSFQLLGRFRTDVNRGMGWVNSYLATDCYLVEPIHNEEQIGTEEVGENDLESQEMLSITLDELRLLAMQGKFLEVQWSNTVSLALLHLT